MKVKFDCEDCGEELKARAYAWGDCSFCGHRQEAPGESRVFLEEVA